MKKLLSVCAAAVLVAGAVMSGGAAVAQESSLQEYGGYSKTEFVSAAVATGVPAAAAEQAWGDEAAMLAIPVSEDVYAENDSTTPQYGTRAVIVNHSGTCRKEQKNALGQVLWQFRLTKTWQVNSTVTNVIPTGTPSIATTLSWGWSYGGLVNQNNYYSGTSHVSTRTGNFSNQFPDSFTLSSTVTIKANKNGTYVCS